MTAQRDPAPYVRYAVALLARSLGEPVPWPLYDPRVGQPVEPPSDPTALLREARAVIEAALGEGWQPIETAPKDGTEIVAIGRLKSDDRYQIRRACITRWSSRPEPPVYAEGWSFSAPGISDLFVPEVWMPLAPPARSTGETDQEPSAPDAAQKEQP